MSRRFKYDEDKEDTVAIGRIPNVYLGAISFDQLRSLKTRPYFYALPPADSICISGPSSYRYVRQDDPLWDRLHVGRLTTGYLPEALGLYHPLTAKQLGIHRSSYGKFMQSIYLHLSNPPYLPSTNPSISEVQAEQHNQTITSSFNEERAPANSDSIITEAIKLKNSMCYCASGLDAIRKSWGNIQEAATLNDLLSVPSKQHLRLHEAGLWMLDQEKMIPKEWGFEKGSLPPLGASPDALYYHGDSRGLPVPHQVVEVKNTCPFSYYDNRNGKSHNRSHARTGYFAVHDRGPRLALDPLWIPQIQFHMLCTGATSALLVSRSATKGMMLFTVNADAKLQRLMLCVIRKFYTEYVLKRTTPHINIYMNMKEHQSMIRKIKAMASTVRGEHVIVEDNEKKGMLNSGDALRFFLDTYRD